MLFVDKKRKKLKNRLKKIFINKGIIVNLRVDINNGLSVY